MDAVMEKECSALGGLFQSIMNDMKASYPAWEDFVSKGAKLQSQLRTTIIVIGSFLDAFQKVADIATGTRGATKEIGSALTRMCMRHRSIENKLKLFTTAFMDNLISPLELTLEEWKKVANQLDKDHAKEYKKARADIRKKSSDTIKLQKKVKKGKDEVRMQLDSALQDVNTRYTELEETEKRAACRALIEERGRFCSFVTMLKPVLDEEISVLGEVTHLQSILEDLCNLTVDPSALPPASEQVILDLKGSEYSYTFQTPPASPSNTLSRKSSISSNYASVRHVPSLDSISSVMDGLHLQMQDVRQIHNIAGTENGTSRPHPHQVYSGYGERARAQSTSGKAKTAREQLALTLAGTLNSETPHTSRDSLHCSSGYSTQTTTPSCSEDAIPSQHAVKKEPPLYDYDYISLHGGDDTPSPSDFDKSCTIPRNSELSLNYRKLFQSKRPASTVSLLSEPESLLLHQTHTATIRRKPSSKANLRRGTISGGVPIPISTPQVPLKPAKSQAGLAPGRSGSEEAVFTQVHPQAAQHPSSDLAHVKLSHCTSTQNTSTVPTPYYAMFPGQPPVGIMEQVTQTSKQQQRQFQPHNDNHQQYNQKQLQYHQDYNTKDHPIQYQQRCNQTPQELQYQQYIQAQHQYTPQHHYKQQYQQQMQHKPAQNPQFPKQQHSIQQHDQKQQNQQNCQLPQQNAALQCWSSAPAPDTANQSDDMNDSRQMESGGIDMLSMIRRGVKLRRTITNDRSAPLITTNYLN
ncbi:protein MTSS 1 isoform X3 [Tachysurus fulvidraco]|uniref:protein MTSS 1 isoform X3 n=1 Tax=Tachysurus fulvidraco TaxID=1234273 RepID=UPI001FF02D7B|nr:protein MTSS 1 isoform X3 [Tachysurus fulvidraco]